MKRSLAWRIHDRVTSNWVTETFFPVDFGILGIPFHISPPWTWKPHLHDQIIGQFNNLPGVIPWRWGFYIWFFEMGDRGGAKEKYPGNWWIYFSTDTYYRRRWGWSAYKKPTPKPAPI